MPYLEMYKLLIRTEDARNRREGPCRKVVDLPFRQAEFKDSSPLLEDKREVNQLMGNVHLFKCREMGREPLQHIPPTLQTKLEIKTQVVFVNHLSQTHYTEILSHLEQRMDHVELVQTITKYKQQPGELTAMVVYFRNMAISEEFHSMVSDSHHQLAFYIKEVIILQSQQETALSHEISPLINGIINDPKTSIETKQDINIYKQKWIEIPTCPTCLQKLEYDLTGLSPSLPLNITELPCKTCLIIAPKTKQPTTPLCEDCNSPQDNWICMVCNRVGCGRYRNADAFQHFQHTGHIVSMDLQTQRIWNYLSDCFCHRVIPLQKQEITLKFPDPTHNNDPHHSQQSLESSFWQYCSVVSEQLERQRNFYQKLQEEEKDRYHRETVKADKTLLELEKELVDKAQTVKKISKKNRKMEKRATELKNKISQDRSLLGQYEMRIKEQTKQTSLAELEKTHPKILQKLHILHSVQTQIDHLLIRLSE